jgi:hypothetical protein
LEETGYDGDFEQVGEWTIGPYADQIGYLFIARNCELVRPQELDDSEFIEIELFDLDEFLDLVR